MKRPLSANGMREKGLALEKIGNRYKIQITYI